MIKRIENYMLTPEDGLKTRNIIYIYIKTQNIYLFYFVKPTLNEILLTD